MGLKNFICQLNSENQKKVIGNLHSFFSTNKVDGLIYTTNSGATDMQVDEIPNLESLKINDQLSSQAQPSCFPIDNESNLPDSLVLQCNSMEDDLRFIFEIKNKSNSKLNSEEEKSDDSKNQQTNKRKRQKYKKFNERFEPWKFRPIRETRSMLSSQNHIVFSYDTEPSKYSFVNE